jgi:hypothetical protein
MAVSRSLTAAARPGARRRRLTRVGLTASAILAAGIAAALVLTLRAGGSASRGPASGAASVVPADALAYVHVSVDPRRPAVKRALALAARFPDFPVIDAAVLTRLSAIVGGGATGDWAGGIRPWLGNEAALALLNTSTSTAGSLIVLDVRAGGRARAFLARAGVQPDGTYEGVILLRYPTGSAAAFVKHYLVIGQDASVRAAIDVASGHARSLQSSSAYRNAARAEPGDRVLDAYASAAGVRRLLAAQGGIVGALGVLLYQPSLVGVTISLSPAAGGLRVRVHSALDPTLAHLSGSPEPEFTPTLARALPSGTALMLDVTGLDRVAPRVLSAGAAGGVAGRIGPLLARLGAALSAEGVDVHSLVSMFDGETAVAIVPGPPSAAARPALVILTRTHDEQRTSAQLAALQLPLEQLFPAPTSGPGQAPMFLDRQVASVTVHQLSLVAGLQLNYAVFDGLLVVSTSLEAIGQIARHGRSLMRDPEYRATISSTPSSVGSLLFLDFSQLLSLGEQTGLIHSSRYRALRADLEKIRAIGLDSTRGEADTTAELFLQIS